MNRRRHTMLIGLTLLITACGQAGDLYLPGQTTPATELPPADIEESKEDDEDAAAS
ncbi:MAG: lipoprotein [Pseudomonadota bacterium]